VNAGKKRGRGAKLERGGLGGGFCRMHGRRFQGKGGVRVENGRAGGQKREKASAKVEKIR